MYDLNGDGVITKTELGNVLVAVCELMGIDMKLPVSFSLQKKCSRIEFECIDKSSKFCQSVLHSSFYSNLSTFQTGSTLGLDYFPKKGESVSIDMNGLLSHLLC